MLNTFASSLISLLVFLLLIPFERGETPGSNEVPQNIILLIGDGMSYSQISAAEYSHGRLNMTSMPYQGIVSTYSYDNRVTDSAAAATAIASGYKTKNRTLGVLPDGTPVQSIAQYATEIGKSTALLASCRITHATPAAFAVHHDDRGDEHIIAEKFVDSGIDMILGAGSNYFLPGNQGGSRNDSRNLIAEMKEKGYIYIDNNDELERISEHKKVIAFLEPEDLKPYPERGDQMLRLTLAALEQLAQNPEGFFFMIEAAQIDWAGHDNDAEWLKQEMIDFDNVIGAVLGFAEKEGNTLVVVTADHETGGLTLPEARFYSRNDYRYDFSTGDHTAQHVPVFSYGPSAQKFAGSLDNTDIGRILFSLWGKEIN